MTKTIQIQELKYKDLTDSEFLTLDRKSKKIPLTPFGQFCFSAGKLDFCRKSGETVYNWEVFNSGYSIEEIIDDECPIHVKPKNK